MYVARRAKMGEMRRSVCVAGSEVEREKKAGERGKVVKIRRSDGVERYNNDT